MLRLFLNFHDMNSSDNRSASEHFYFIDALRGIGAIWVVLFHIHLDDRLAQLYQVLPLWILAPIFEWGGLGVAIFFVISGFVMAHSLRNATLTFPYVKQFFLRRIARLNPPYYFSIGFALLLSLIAATVKGEPFAPMNQALTLERFLAHLVYLQELCGFANINDSYWTLCLEVQFYIVFVLLLGLSQWLARKSYPISRNQVFLASAIVSALYPIGVFGVQPRATFFLEPWYSFMLGVLAYWAWKRQLREEIFYGYAGVIFAGSIMQPDRFPAASAICAIAFLNLGQTGRLGQWLKEKAFQFLGKISYSLYLIHGPILGVVFFIGQRVLPPSPFTDLVCTAITLISCLIASTLMWRRIEKPSVILSQKLKTLPSTAVI